VGAVAVIGALVLFGARGYPATRPHLLSGTAWLASSQIGALTLLDGSSAEVAAQVQVAPAGTRLDVVQQGTTAYAVNHGDGSVRRVDGATFTVGPPVVPLPEAGAGLAVFAGPGAVYALDPGRGILSGADPRSLAPRLGPVSVAPSLATEGAAFDDSGRLWLLDPGTGDLVWVDKDGRHTRRGAAQPGGGMLVLAGGAPVLVDPAARTASLLDRRTGAARGTTDLDLRPGDRIHATGSTGSAGSAGAGNAAHLYVVAARGVLNVCDLTAEACPTVVPLGGPGADLGPAVESGRRVFVPDYATGEVWIVDLDQPRVVARPKVLDPRTHFQLLSRDGVVFFNDPDSEHAGVIRLDGGVRAVPKYDPGAKDRSKSGPKPKPSGSGRTPPPGKAPAPAPAPAPVPTPDPSGPAVHITVSTNQPRVGESIGLGLVADSGPAPTGAHWDFGDGTEGDGLPVTHTWTAEGNYLVTAKATLPGNKKVTASLTLQLTVRPPVIARLTVATQGSGTGAVSSQPVGIGCPGACTADFGIGGTVTLTAVAGAGAEFTGWGGACAGAGTALDCTVTIPAGGASVSASFATRPRLHLTVTGSGSVTGSGISCAGDCVIALDAGQRVTLTAVPGPNFDFTGWSGACGAGTGTCTVTMNGDQAAGAAFRSRGPLPAPVLLSPADGASISHPKRLEMVDVPVSWQPVPGADHYELESVSHSFVTGKDFGDKVDITTAINGIVVLDCTFPTEGPFKKWRVTAIAADGTRGTSSAWRTMFCG
jgi:hypothetical protein